MPIVGRQMTDFTSARKNLYEGAKQAAMEIPPYETPTHIVRLADVDYDPNDDEDAQPERFNFAAQKRAIYEKDTLGRRLRGTWQMVNKATGEVEQEQRRLLAVVPRVNEYGSMIYRGSYYAMQNQQRVKPGAFARLKKNDELETFVNVKQGTGSSHRYILNPETGVFYFNIGHSKVPLASILKMMGTRDEQLREAWGPELAKINLEKQDKQALNKLYEKLVPSKYKVKNPDDQMRQFALLETFKRMKVDPWSMKRNTGRDTDSIDADTILAATSKVLKMNRGESGGDDRDHLAFQTFHTVEDIIPERIRLDKNRIQKQVIAKAMRRGGVSAIPPKALQSQIEAAIFSSGLAVQPELANPLDSFDRATRLTKMGEGGMSSTDSVPMESRDVHPSQYGFVDPARTVECGPAYMEVMTDRGWITLDRMTPQTRFACLINGRVEFHLPVDIQSYDYDGYLCSFESKTVAYDLTPNHRMWTACCHSGSEYRFETAESIVGKQRIVMCGGHAPYIGENASQRRVKSPVFENAGITARDLPEYFNVEDWAEFMGWYLGEGSTAGDSHRGGRNTTAIAQCRKANPENWERINALLLRMGLKFHAGERSFQISNTHLATYMSQFNGSAGRYVPEHILEFSVEARRRFLEAIMLAEACTYKNPESGKRVFQSGSLSLAEDVLFIAFTLGYSTNLTKVVDNREERYLDGHRVTLHTRTTRRVGRTKVKGDGHKKKRYTGKVYCATVPGSLMYWRMPGKSGFWVGNSLKTGIDVNLAANTFRGEDGRLYTWVINARTGQRELKTPEDLIEANVQVGQYSDIPGLAEVSLKNGGGEDYALPEEVDYIIPDFQQSGFSPLSNLIAMKSAGAQNRLAMGARFIAQSVPLANREAPLVQQAVPGTGGARSTNMDMADRVGAVFAQHEGVVTDITPDGITIKTAEGPKNIPLHNWTPLGSKTGLHNTPVVKVGSRVGPGQLLAKSNFTADDGSLALGVNARIAMMPWGDNYEDAITVSRSFAKRMTSEHLYRHRLSPQPEQRVKRSEFVSALPSAYNKDQLDKLDDTGVIQVGQTVRKGDPLVLAATPKVSNNLRKRQTKSYSDDTVTWDHDDDGIVQEVHRARNGDVVVAVGATSSLKGSDKISDLYGAKGIVRILPDEVMPHDESGRPFDAVASDLGVISRQNPNRPHEALLGKIAAARGQPYILDDFEGKDLDEFVDQELKKYGIPDRETVIDPRNGRRIPGVYTGVAHLLKLHHLSESKAHARGVGAYTCHDEQTEVLTLHGWIPWAQATMQTQFATVLPDWSIQYELPTAVTAQYYEGELYGFTGRYLDYLVTPNHRMFVKRPNRKGRSERPFEFKPASEVPGTPGSRGWQVVQGGLKWAATVTGDVTIPVPAYLSLKRKTYHPLTVNELDYAELLGWFVSEGSTTYNKKSRSYEVAISQVQAVNPENFARIEQLLRRLGMSYTYVKDKKRVGKEIRGFRIRNKQWYYHLRELGVGCENKRIPCRIFQGSNAVQRAFLDALMAGDGCYTAQPDGSVCGRYTTTSKELADGLQELLLKLGMGGSVSEVQGRTDRHQTVYEVGLFLTRTIATLGTQKRSTAKFYQQPYAGMVYCATVPSGLLITRRNGKVLLSGNSDGTPAKGSEDDAQAKRLSNQELGALVAHGANSFIRESALLRGQNDPEFQARYMSGVDLPAMKVPFVYNKFLAYMKAAGINPVKQGSKTKLMLMNDKDAMELAGDREVRVGETVDLNKDMKPIKGGLFDENIFGADGSRWGRYQLSEPIPHPLMEDVFRKLMGVTKDQYRDIYAGRKEFKEFGTGPKAITGWLKQLDVDREVQFARKAASDSRKTKREEAVVRLRYLRGLADRNIDPKTLMVTQVPILPPVMRPVSRLAGKDTPLIDGMNLLYRDLIEADKNLGNLKGFSNDVSNERLALYDAVQAAVGLREPVDPEMRSKQVTGLVKRLVGKSGPKTSFVQRKLLSGTVDMVGRAVIGPSHKIGMDEIGVPEEQAWKLYSMPVIRALKREGMPLVKAKQLVDSRDPIAKRKIEEVMQQLPVVASRAPVLHKFGIMAFRPKMVEGHSLLMSPLVYSPFGADNDGDAMNFHVVMGEEAAKDAFEKMLPSKNLFSPRDFKSVNYAPGQDHALGIFLASQMEPDKNSRPQVFRSMADAAKAFERGEININTPITVLH